MATGSVDTGDRPGSDLRDCRARLRAGSRSFHAAALLLPAGFCRPAAALYAFCRVADDAVDIDPDPVQALRALHARLDALYAGRPHDHAADRALAEVVERFAIPQALFAALFEGFAWDAAGRRYADRGQLLDYAARVAGTVGAMMALLMGVRDRDMLARACDLGAAMQLTNIARDVGEDARNGRLYLPESWLREAGVDPDAFVARPVFTPALGGVVQRLLDDAESLYRRADSGIARLPRRCRPAMYTARLLYAEIGREIERRHCDSVTQRAVVSPRRKLRTLLGLARLVGLSGAALTEPADPATAFLVAAAAQAAPASRALTIGRARHEGRLAWMLELFADLDRRERAAAGATPLDDASALAQEAPAR
ncbi:MAG: phytoene/squalene synthase family protein [Gammaproteobacteria bacterium]|nr:phytoene/squalene synthase family protein [Gammaproteobacteria bacterium]